MVAKKSHHDSEPKNKQVNLRAHHARPYRKRHIGLLVISLAALVLLAIVLVQYRDQIISGFSSSRGFVSDLFVQKKTYDTKITSSHGFNVSYDQKTYYASAISDDNGDLYIGQELSVKRAYSTVRITPSFSDGSQTATSPSALTLTYHSNKDSVNEPSEAVALKDGGIDAANVERKTTTTASIGSESFKKITWESKQKNEVSSSLSAKFITYSGVVRGDVVTVVISLGVNGSDESIYIPVLDSVRFDNNVSYNKAPTNDVVSRVTASRSILDTITGTSVASAATKGVDLTGSEKVAALYSPAVVKIYNVYCMDIAIDGKDYLQDSCGASSGSGFFVSQDGYLGTNGHVAVTTPLDIVISHAIQYYATKGDPKYFNNILALTDLKKSDIPAGATQKQAIGIMVNAMYKIDPSRIVASNDVQNLLVQVTPDNPDITSLLEKTKDREKYSDKSVLRAKLVASDYRASDGYDGFKASDVAIIKVDGTNFPVVKLGSIDTITQGSGLSILGYPGNASDNGIVDSESSEATLTTGKVSSKKNALGSDNKLIETDTTIGHGNSGGPALDDDGSVVGIATYTADGSGEGNGVFNYIRDVKDLVELASDKSIIFDTNSKTQSEWEKGIGYFYTAHYSKAIKSFEKVQTLYPNDSRVAEFIAASEKRIANGEDVVDFPLVPVVIIAAVILLGAIGAVFFIVRHHKKHLIYNAGVAQGSVQPANPGTPTQTVVVSRNGPTAGVPLVSTPASLIQPPTSIPGVQPVVTPPAPVTRSFAPPPVSLSPQTPPPAEPPVPPTTPSQPTQIPVNPWFTAPPPSEDEKKQ